MRGTGFLVVTATATTIDVFVGTPRLLGEGSSGESITLQRGETLEVLLAGVGGQYLFRFTALAPGTTTLELVYRRSFDPPEVESDRTFTLDVTVN